MHPVLQEELSSFRQQSREKHKQDIENLHASLSQQYREDLLNLKMDLSDKYICEIETLKKRHSLELEQLRARLSKEHIKGEMILVYTFLREAWIVFYF